MTKKVAIVTGGGRGIGRAHCLALAEQGYAVVVNDIGTSTAGDGFDTTPAESVTAEIRGLGGTALVSSHDVSDWNAAGDLIRFAVDELGQLDVLINNAGIIRDAVLYKLTEAQWDDVIRIHLRGTAATSHHAAVYWRNRFNEHGPFEGRLINTTSGSAFAGNVGQANYTAAKAGIIAFTLTASLELARYGVTANAIAPAAASRMLASIYDEERMESLDPAYIARMAAWLCSPKAGSVTGRVFSVSGQDLFVAEGWSRGPSARIPADISAERLSDFLEPLLRDSQPVNQLLDH